MTNSVSRRDNCRFCGARNLELALHLTPSPLALAYVPEDRLSEDQSAYPLDIFLCHDCGYAGMLDVVERSALWDESSEVTSRSLGVVEDLRQLAEAIVARISPPRDSLAIDIGSNDGTLLKFLQQRGLRVLGVEPAGPAVELAVGSGVPTLRKYFSADVAQTIKDEWGTAKVVTANRVFANIDDLNDVVEGVRILLEPDGAFVFETGYLVDILEHGLFETIYHEHLGYESVKPLAAFFRRHQMELIDIERLPIKGGSLRGVVQRAGGPGTVSSSISSLISMEEGLEIHTIKPFKAFANKIDAIKNRLDGLLGELETNGKTVAGYGAAQSSTTLIYHFGLGNKLGFLVDDDPKTQGLYSPGHHIPVLAPRAIYERTPDYVLLLAWRYAEAIIKKHQAYLEQGGHFIIPMPEVEVC